jgi:hypothetical protein
MLFYAPSQGMVFGRGDGWGELPAHFLASFILINLQHFAAILGVLDMKNGGIY